MAYFTAPAYYNIVREMPAGKGYADMVFVPRNTSDRPAIVVELKWNQSVGAAIDQIKKRQYVECLKGYTGEVLLVGVNYDAGKEGFDEYKKHECRIEKVDFHNGRQFIKSVE